MTLPNPKFAPRRNDLPWLRRRRKPVVLAETAPPAKGAAPAARGASTSTRAAPAGSSAGGPPHGSTGKIDYTRRDRTRPATAPTTPVRAPDVTPRSSPRPEPTASPAPRPSPTRTPTPAPRPAAAAGGDPLDLSAPTPTPTSGGDPLDLSAPSPAPASGGGDPLDLSGPAPTPPAPPRSAAPGSTSLDLGGPPPSTPPAQSGGGSTSLDLGGSPTPPAPSSSTSLDLGGSGGGSGGAAGETGGRSGAGRAPKPAPAPARHHVVRRTRRGAATLLEFSAPVVTLGRVQSGVGSLTFDAVVGDDVGDLRLGAAWTLTDGRTGTVELEADRKQGPPGRGAVVWAGREGRFERISLDLRQSRSLARLMLYAFSPTKQTVRWGGTVVVTTFGGDRIDAPIVSAPSPAVLALVTLYQVDGEFVVRSEMDPVAGTVRDTCRAFGYDRITWLDDRTPVA